MSTLAVVIVHGKNELEIVEYISTNLKIKIGTYSRDKGRNSIQINSLDNVLKNFVFENKRNFLNTYPGIYENENSKKFDNFKIFTIMDTDDVKPPCSIRNYKCGEMFAKYWFKDYIVPIYNDNKLEDILIATGYLEPKSKVNNETKRNNIKIFPKNRAGKNIEEIEEFYIKLKSCPNTNMDEFVKYCMDNS